MNKSHRIRKNGKASGLTVQPRADPPKTGASLDAFCIWTARSERKPNAKRLVSRSSFRRAIQKQLPLVRRATCELSRKRDLGWKEVACIDFAGYLDRDCDERMIYKTPEGGLKPAKHSVDEPEVIEGVTREQVTKWVQQCLIPDAIEPR